MTLLQYQMLRAITNEIPCTLNTAYGFKQHTFGSLCKNHWIYWDIDSETFQPTHGGLKQLHFNLTRYNPRQPLSKNVPTYRKFKLPKRA